MKFYKPKHFKIYELVPPRVMEDIGEPAWSFFNPGLLRDLDQLRDDLGPLTVNNYYWGGRFQARGLRLPGMPDYRRYSQHSFGNAVDFDVKGMEAESVRQHILHNASRYPSIKAMEKNVNWVHIDARNIINSKIFLFHP